MLEKISVKQLTILLLSLIRVHSQESSESSLTRTIRYLMGNYGMSLFGRFCPIFIICYLPPPPPRPWVVAPTLPAISFWEIVVVGGWSKVMTATGGRRERPSFRFRQKETEAASSSRREKKAERQIISQTWAGGKKEIYIYLKKQVFI